MSERAQRTLFGEPLIPFKTIARSVTGHKWLFVEDRGDDDGGDYPLTFISMQDIPIGEHDGHGYPSFSLSERIWVTASGAFEIGAPIGAPTYCADLVAVMKPWEPRAGQDALALGFAKRISSGQAFQFTSWEPVQVLGETDYYDIWKTRWAPLDATMLIHRRNLRKP